MFLRAPKRQFQVVTDVVGKCCYWHSRSGQIGLQRQLDCVAKQVVNWPRPFVDNATLGRGKLPRAFDVVLGVP
jgi:hypothetical protein